jgi:hypothetical protein
MTKIHKKDPKKWKEKKNGIVLLESLEFSLLDSKYALAKDTAM